MATTRRVKTPAASIYNTKDEADKAIAQIAQLQRQRSTIAGVAETRISKITEAARVQIAPIDEEITQIVTQLSLYAEYNRRELTNNDKVKTVKFAHGVLQWRFTPIAVTIKGADAVLQRLKVLGLTQFIRTKETVDKEAMGRERAIAETIEGVTFGRHEEFVVIPNETNLEILTKMKVSRQPDGSQSH